MFRSREKKGATEYDNISLKMVFVKRDDEVLISNFYNREKEIVYLPRVGRETI